VVLSHRFRSKGGPSRSPLLLTTLLVCEHWSKLETHIRKLSLRIFEPPLYCPASEHSVMSGHEADVSKPLPLIHFRTVLNFSKFQNAHRSDQPSDRFPIPSHEDNEWAVCLEPLITEDRLRCEAWREEVQNILIFVGIRGRALPSVCQW